MKTVVVNAIGGPGSGKSTLSFGLVAALKARGHRAECVLEYAKELTYRRDWETLKRQDVVTTEQDRRIRDLIGHVDFVIMDTSLPLGIIYAPEPYQEDWFARRAWELFDGYNNFTIFVRRVKAYQTYGRSQTEGEAQEIDKRILKLFDGRIDLTVDGAEGSVEQAYESLMKFLPD